MIPTVSAQYVGAYNVYDDGQVVGATARCSCGVGHYGYETSYFVDRCPNCGGNLAFEQCDLSNGVVAGFTSVEGMWFCTSCDMDFCAQCGKSHDNRGYWLTRAYAPQPKEPEPEPEPEPKDPSKEPTKLEMFQELFELNTLQLIIELSS